MFPSAKFNEQVPEYSWQHQGQSEGHPTYHVNPVTGVVIREGFHDKQSAYHEFESRT